MKSFKQLSPMETYHETRPKLPKETKEAEMKSKNSAWSELGGGLLSMCGDKKDQAFKGWITTSDDIPKGTKIHCNTYEQSMGLSITIAKLNRKI